MSWVRSYGSSSTGRSTSRSYGSAPRTTPKKTAKQKLLELEEKQKSHGLWWCDHGRGAKRVSRRQRLLSIVSMAVRKADPNIQRSIRITLRNRLAQLRVDGAQSVMSVQISSTFLELAVQLCITASKRGAGDLWVQNWAQVHDSDGMDADEWDEMVMVMALEWMLGVKIVILQPTVYAYRKKGSHVVERKVVTGLHPELVAAQHGEGWEPHTYMSLCKDTEGHWSILMWNSERGRTHAFGWESIPPGLRRLADLFARNSCAKDTRLR